MKIRFFYENWYNRGLQYLEQIYDFRVGRFFNFQTFQEIYDIQANDFLKYNQLLSSIPKIWNNSIKNEPRPSNYNENPINKILSAKKATKILYGHQLKNESRPEVKLKKSGNNT